MEDKIMNTFIKEELDIFEIPGLSGEAKYKKLDSIKQNSYDFAMMQYFQNAQKEKAKENDRYASMDFENFVKLFNPNEGFTKVLRDKNSEPGPANVWFDIYNQDTGLMKESALKGLRRMIAAKMG